MCTKNQTKSWINGFCAEFLSTHWEWNSMNHVPNPCLSRSFMICPGIPENCTKIRDNLNTSKSTEKLHKKPKFGNFYKKRSYAAKTFLAARKFDRICVFYSFTGSEERYFLTMSAILKIIAWSNWRRSSPVSFLILSRRYTREFLCKKSFREVS